MLGPGFTSTHLTHQGLSEFFEGSGNDYLFNLAYNLNWLKFLRHTNQISKSETHKVLDAILKGRDL